MGREECGYVVSSDSAGNKASSTISFKRCTSVIQAVIFVTYESQDGMKR